MKIGLWKKGLVLGIILLFVGAGVIPSTAVDNIEQCSMPSSNGKTLYVGGSGEGNYTIIQDAIDDASDGYTVFVFDNSSPYYEHVKINKSINLIGEDRNTTVIDGSNIGSVIHITAGRGTVRGFTIQNSGEKPNNAGVNINSSNNTISGNTFSSNEVGINTEYSTNNIFSYNYLSNNWCGILQSYSNDSTITRNTYTNNTYAINNFHSNNSSITLNTVTNNHIGIRLSHSISNNIIKNNIRNNNYCGITLEHSNNNKIIVNNITLNYHFGIIGLSLSDNNTISVNNISSNNEYGVLLDGSKFNTITGNTINSNNLCGIYLSATKFNTITGNTITSSFWEGIYLDDSSSNNITGNIISNNGGGINSFGESINNIIMGNYINFNKDFGICLEFSNNNTITSNNISSNKKYGITLEDFSNNNTIYHNNFINNTQNAYDECKNTWDNGYPSGGNFWDDYNGTDSDEDGIGDTPHPISGGNNKDNYPLGNFPPDKPDIDGPSKGKQGVEHSWILHSEDPECESIYFYIDWGDGNIVDWFGPNPSCMPVEACHIYEKTGSYVIAVKVKDIYDAESDIAEFEVEIPRNRTKFNSFFHWLLNRFQMLERLLDFIKIM